MVNLQNISEANEPLEDRQFLFVGDAFRFEGRLAIVANRAFADSMIYDAKIGNEIVTVFHDRIDPATIRRDYLWSEAHLETLGY